MRWFAPTRGSTRIIKRFAMLPIEVNKENRWLEWCYIKQEYYVPCYCGESYWKPIKFVAEEDYEHYKESLYKDASV